MHLDTYKTMVETHSHKISQRPWPFFAQGGSDPDTDHLLLERITAHPGEGLPERVHGPKHEPERVDVYLLVVLERLRHLSIPRTPHTETVGESSSTHGPQVFNQT